MLFDDYGIEMIKSEIILNPKNIYHKLHEVSMTSDNGFLSITSKNDYNSIRFSYIDAYNATVLETLLNSYFIIVV